MNQQSVPINAVEIVDHATSEQLDTLLERVDELVRRAATWHDPQSGSPLAGDDRRLTPYELSHTARNALTGSVDQLQTVALILRAGAIPSRGLFPLLRGALENASAAVWLLAPASRPERIRRTLRWHAMNIKFREKAFDLLSEAAEHAGTRMKGAAEEQTKLVAIAQAAGFPDPQKVLGGNLGYGDMTKEAGNDPQVGLEAAELVWNLCSGMSHAQQWAVLNLSDQVALPGSTEERLQLQLTASNDSIFVCVAMAVEMTVAGWDLLGKRGTSYRVPSANGTFRALVR